MRPLAIVLLLARVVHADPADPRKLEAAVTAATDPDQRGVALAQLGLATADAYTAASLLFAGYVLHPDDAVAHALGEVEAKVRAYRASADGAKLLERVHVDGLAQPPNRDPKYHAPIDDALIVVLVKAGASFATIGMSRSMLQVRTATCSETATHAFACTVERTDLATDKPLKPLALSGELARAVALNLRARKISQQKVGDHLAYVAPINCAGVPGDGDLGCNTDAN